MAAEAATEAAEMAAEAAAAKAEAAVAKAEAAAAKAAAAAAKVTAAAAKVTSAAARSAAASQKSAPTPLPRAAPLDPSDPTVEAPVGEAAEPASVDPAKEAADAAEAAAIARLVDEELQGWEIDLPDDDELSSMEAELGLSDDLFEGALIKGDPGADDAPPLDLEDLALDGSLESEEEEGLALDEEQFDLEDDYPVISKAERKKSNIEGAPLRLRRKPSAEDMERIRQQAMEVDDAPDSVPKEVQAFTRLAEAKKRAEAAEDELAKAKKRADAAAVAAARIRPAKGADAGGDGACAVGVEEPYLYEDELQEIALDCDNPGAADEAYKYGDEGGYGDYGDDHAADFYDEGGEEDGEESEGWLPTFGRQRRLGAPWRLEAPQRLEAARRQGALRRRQRRRVSTSSVSTEREWTALWRERFVCWYVGLALPTQRALGSCVGALSLHLGSRLDTAWRAAQTIAGRTPAPSAPVGLAEPGCKWLKESSMEFPEVPAFPDKVDFALPPIPRLLPSWQQLQSLRGDDGFEGFSSEQLANLVPNLIRVDAAAPAPLLASLAAGSGFGALAGVGLALGVLVARRRGGRPSVRKATASKATASKAAASKAAGSERLERS